MSAGFLIGCFLTAFSMSASLFHPPRRMPVCGTVPCLVLLPQPFHVFIAGLAYRYANAWRIGGEPAVQLRYVRDEIRARPLGGGHLRGHRLGHVRNVGAYAGKHGGIAFYHPAPPVPIGAQLGPDVT